MNYPSSYKFTLHDCNGFNSFELSQDTISQLITQLDNIDWKREMRFICLNLDRGPAPGESSWVPELIGYLNLFGHPNGVFVEALVPRTQGSRDDLKPYCPIRSGNYQAMSRIWVGLRYRRVPLECLIAPHDVPLIVRHYLEHPGDRFPTIEWQSEEEIHWQFHLSPEDDWFDPAEPETRPASQESVTKDELLLRLQASYRQFGLDPNWIQWPMGRGETLNRFSDQK